ncbi:MAG: hypothetical protein D6760_02585 [Deltaproteobacteria bacterium]|nr:MAG: hypothetical protein D6760_02585 [Deltaproteobacteria bacterium]
MREVSPDARRSRSVRAGQNALGSLAGLPARLAVRGSAGAVVAAAREEAPAIFPPAETIA